MLLCMWVELPLRGGKEEYKWKVGDLKDNEKISRIHSPSHHQVACEIQFQFDSTLRTRGSKGIIYR